MSQSPSQQQLDTLPTLPAEARYDFLVRSVLENEQVWTLRGDAGTVLMSCDGDDCLPIWPHAEFAQQWVSGDWADCEPLAIDLAAWLERWLPGLKEDGLALAVFPGKKEEGIVLEPLEFLELLSAGQD
ncbi:hypothetical protein BGP77_01795 [Saccharospirillum sp. MSK14-1]|uniref:DUF2750 domain-containing protein n=1 Tax=Saccharospirillum sp. MSK14-1 TaxID=1897632 RepID=UPI000D4AE971|nr:DUF2750 domain-containing protein [Saccharospirillum sp. MSK14-1]PTY36075.1 hypothetical protein BGP77_01795 [Saccharospirillum sp. MSK14-1]